MALVIDGSGNFQSLDLTTGVSNPISNILGGSVYGLGELGSNVYGLNAGFGATGIQTLSINPTTGSYSVLATTPNPYLGSAMGSTTTGLYVLGYDANMYSIDPTTGVATLLGPTGLGQNLGGYWGLSAGGSSLYLTYDDPTGTDELLGLVNTSDGAVTPLGQVTIDSPTVEGMAYVQGQWYVTAGPGPLNQPSEVESLNISTLTATYVSTTPNVGAGLGLVPFVTPEPAPMAAFGLGVLGLALRRKKRVG